MRKSATPSKGRAEAAAARPIATEDTTTSIRARFIGLLSFQCEQIREQPVRAGHARGELSEKRQTRVDVSSLAQARDEESALELGSARIGHCQQRREGGVPRMGEIEAALLHPAFPV